jgi:hypothetical protein
MTKRVFPELVSAAERDMTNNPRPMEKHLLLLCLLAADANAASWHPTDRMLHAVGYVESTHGLFTWGDNGRSLGEYQLSDAAWLDVTAWRKAHNLPTFGYENHVWNQSISRAYAADYLAILHRELKKRLDHPPTPAEVYAAYNMGLSSFAQCRYQIAKVNPVTARKCEQIRVLLRDR